MGPMELKLNPMMVDRHERRALKVAAAVGLISVAMVALMCAFGDYDKLPPAVASLVGPRAANLWKSKCVKTESDRSVDHLGLGSDRPYSFDMHRYTCAFQTFGDTGVSRLVDEHAPWPINELKYFLNRGPAVFLSALDQQQQHTVRDAQIDIHYGHPGVVYEHSLLFNLTFPLRVYSRFACIADPPRLPKCFEMALFYSWSMSGTRCTPETCTRDPMAPEVVIPGVGQFSLYYVNHYDVVFEIFIHVLQEDERHLMPREPLEKQSFGLRPPRQTPS